MIFKIKSNVTKFLKCTETSPHVSPLRLKDMGVPLLVGRRGVYLQQIGFNAGFKHKMPGYKTWQDSKQKYNFT